MKRLAMILAAPIAAAICVLAAPGAAAATLQATPANVQAQLAAAKDGDTVQAVGVFAGIGVNGQYMPGAHAVPVTLDLSRAVVVKLAIYNASGWRVVGGDIGAGAPYSAVQVINSAALTFEDNLVHGYGAKGGAGFSLKDSHDVAILANTVRDAPGDGVDVVNSWNVTIKHNGFAGMTYGQVVHVDGVQIWNVAGDPDAVANVDVEGNNFEGYMQAITAFGQDVSRPMLGIKVAWNAGIIGTQWGVAMDQARPNVPAMPDLIAHDNHFEPAIGYPTGYVPPGTYGKNGAPIPGNYSCSIVAGVWSCPPPALPSAPAP